MLEGVPQVHEPVPRGLPAAPPPAPEPVAAVAEGAVLRADDVVGERGERDHRLEGRPRRIVRLDGTVEERVVGIVEESLHLLGGQALREGVRVEGGPGHHRQHIAGLRVEGDDGAFAARERLLGHLLQPHVDGEHEVVPGHARTDAFALGDEGLAVLVHGGLDASSLRVDDDLLDAVVPAELLLEARLEPSTADHVAQLVVAAVGFRALELVAADLVHVAEDVGEERAVAIVALRAHLDVHAVEREPVRLDPVEGVARDVTADGDGAEPLETLRRDDALADLGEGVVVEAERPGEPGQGGIDVAAEGGRELHVVGGPRVREDGPAPVEDHAPIGLDLAALDEVRARALGVVVVPRHLQPVQTAREQRERPEADGHHPDVAVPIVPPLPRRRQQAHLSHTSPKPWESAPRARGGRGRPGRGWPAPPRP